MHASNFAGRWSIVTGTQTDDAVEIQARVLLRRYGIVFRSMLTREPNAAPWRELARVYRRLEARGEIRGGRFVHGMSGEQFALPEAIERLREVRRETQDGKLIVLSAADPLNLIGIITSDERIRAVPATRIAWRDGIAVSVMEGDYVRPLANLDETAAMNAPRRSPDDACVATGGWGGRSACYCRTPTLRLIRRLCRGLARMLTIGSRGEYIYRIARR